MGLVPQTEVPDTDPTETAEWFESLDSVLKTQGLQRGLELIHHLLRTPVRVA